MSRGCNLPDHGSDALQGVFWRGLPLLGHLICKNWLPCNFTKKSEFCFCLKYSIRKLSTVDHFPVYKEWPEVSSNHLFSLYCEFSIVQPLLMLPTFPCPAPIPDLELPQVLQKVILHSPFVNQILDMYFLFQGQVFSWFSFNSVVSLYPW